MTVSTHPTVPQDFSIQVAENEGMPSRSNSRGSPPLPARRLTGTLTLGLSKTRAATRGLWSVKEKAAMRQPLASLIATTAAMAGVIASFAFPVLAQDGTGPMPECGATSQLSAGRHRRWMTVTFFDGAGLRPSDQVSMSLLNVAGRELSFAVAISFSGCCLSRSSSMSLSDVAAA